MQNDPEQIPFELYGAGNLKCKMNFIQISTTKCLLMIRVNNLRRYKMSKETIDFWKEASRIEYSKEMTRKGEEALARANSLGLSSLSNNTPKELILELVSEYSEGEFEI